MNARTPIGIHATSPRAIERAAQAWSDAKLSRHLDALSKYESLEELTFAQLLDLQNESSEDDSWDTFNDVSRELRDRRQDAKVALVKLFIEACNTHGRIPMVTGGQIVPMFICDYLREALSTNDGTTWAIDMVMHPNGRDRAVAAMAGEYVRDQAEDLLRAGWTA